MRRVITIGASTVDCLMKSKALKMLKSHEMPGGVAMCEVLGGKIEAEDGVLVTGGGATNVAVGLRRLGHSVKILSRVGDDLLSKMILDDLMKENINTELMQQGKGRTGLSAVLVANNGARSIVTYRGESAEITPLEINWNEMLKADWVQISSLGGNVDLLEDVVSFLYSKKIKIGLNPGKGELDHKDRLIRLLSKVDFVNTNKNEAAVLWGEDFENEKDMILGFMKNGARLVAITNGKNGASIATNGRWLQVEAYPNKSIDDTGAGDAFVSGAVSGILNDSDLETIIKSGLANGGSVVTKLGAKAGLLYKNDMNKWLNKQLKIVEVNI